MTKYNRITGKVFGGNANATGDNPEIGQFGSAKDGSYFGTSDISTIQALPAWGQGWAGAVTPETNFPPLPEMTGAMKVFSEQQCYLLQQGIPEWDNATIYYKNGFSSKNGKIYISQSDENQGNDPETDNTNWKQIYYLNNKITNCILEAPNGVATFSGNTITVKAGLKVLIPNGRNADGTLNNIEYVVDSDKVGNNMGRGAIAIVGITSEGVVENWWIGAILYSDDKPSTSGLLGANLWVSKKLNTISISTGSGDWIEHPIGFIGVSESTDTITSLTPYQPVELLKQSDKSEISGWGMPSSRYITLNIGASGTTYTAPANGWFSCNFSLRQANASGIIWVKMLSQSIGDMKFFTNGTDFEYITALPVRKGDIIVIQYQASSVYVASWETGLRFMYAEGVKE